MSFLLNLLALSPLAIAPWVIFPYTTGKSLVIRSIISVVSICFLVRLLTRQSFREKIAGRFRRLGRNNIFLAIWVYFLFFISSAFLATDTFNAFFGTYGRQEGVVGMFYFLVFFLYTALLFGKKEWIWFFKISLLTAVVLFSYALIQSRQGEPRPESLVGNAIFLSAYFLFPIFAAAILFLIGRQDKDRFAMTVASIAAVISLGGVFLANSRGVIIGLVAGIGIALLFAAFSVWHDAGIQRKRRLSPLIILGTLIIFATIFQTTKNRAFWQYVPGLDRLAQVSMTRSAITGRLYGFKVAINSINPVRNGYKKFLFGWGPENYYIASNLYFDPYTYPIYQPTSEDRAHNKILDVFVTSGLFGALSYLAIWFFVFSLIFSVRLEHIIGSKGERLFLRSVLLFFGIAYFVQNLSSFDSFTTFIPFFAFMGFLIFLELESKSLTHDQINPHAKYALLTASWVALSAFSIVTFIAWTVVPFLQMKTYRDVMTVGNPAKVLQADFIFSPYTNIQKRIRYDLYKYVTATRLAPSDGPLLDGVIDKMEELIRRESFDPYHYVFLGRAYEKRGAISDDQNFFQKAEATFKKAMEFSPERQELLYAYGTFLLNQHREDEARQIFKQALELNVQASVSRFYYGLSLMTSGESSYAQALDNIEFIFDDLANVDLPNPGWARSAYEKLLRYFYEQKDKDRVLKVVKRLVDLDKTQGASYAKLVEIITKTGQMPIIEFK